MYDNVVRYMLFIPRLYEGEDLDGQADETNNVANEDKISCKSLD